MLELLGQAALRTLLLAAIVQLGLGLLRIKRPQLRLIPDALTVDSDVIPLGPLL